MRSAEVSKASRPSAITSELITAMSAQRAVHTNGKTAASGCHEIFGKPAISGAIGLNKSGAHDSAGSHRTPTAPRVFCQRRISMVLVGGTDSFGKGLVTTGRARVRLDVAFFNHGVVKQTADKRPDQIGLNGSDEGDPFGRKLGGRHWREEDQPRQQVLDLCLFPRTQGYRARRYRRCG